MNGANDMNRDHERVSAYLGGMMTAQEAAAFEQDIEGNPELAGILERWRGNDALLQQAYPTPDGADMSSVLLGRLGLADEVSTDNVVALDAFRAQRPAQNDNKGATRWRWPLVGSIAASLVVAIGVGTMWFGKADGIAGDPAFQTAMNRSASGTAVALADAERITPILSFEAKDGRFCREFAMQDGNAGQQGIACNTGGTWTIEALVKGGALLPSSNDIRTAGGTDGASLDAVYDRLGAGDPINAENEKSYISNGWKKN